MRCSFMQPAEHMLRINLEPPEEGYKLNAAETINSRQYGNREPSFKDSDRVWSRQGIHNMRIPEMFGSVQFSELLVGTGNDDLAEKA